MRNSIFDAIVAGGADDVDGRNLVDKTFDSYH